MRTAYDFGVGDGVDGDEPPEPFAPFESAEDDPAPDAAVVSADEAAASFFGGVSFSFSLRA